MKIPFIKVKQSQNENHDCENDTFERKNVQNMTVEKTHQNRSANTTK